MSRSISRRRDRKNARTSRPHRPFRGLEALEIRTHLTATPYDVLADAITQPGSGQLAGVYQQIVAQASNVWLPFIDNPLEKTAALLDQARSALHTALTDMVTEDGEQAVKQAIVDALGPTNLLADRSGNGSIGVEDVEAVINIPEEGDPQIDIQFSLGRTAGVTVDENVGFDLGLPALPIYVLQEDGSVQASFGFEVANVHLGINASGPFLDLENPAGGADVRFFAEAGLSQDFKMTGAFGFIHGEITATDELTGVSAEIDVDLGGENGPAITVDGDAGVNLALKAEVIGPEYPGVSAILHVGWDDGLAQAPVVEFREVSITMSNRFLAPIVEHLEPILKPAGWVVDKLNAPVPVISDLSEAVGLGPISVLSIVETIADWDLLSPDYDAIAEGIVMVSDIIDIVDGIEGGPNDTISFDFGSFQVAGDVRGAAAAGDIALLSDDPLSKLGIAAGSFDPQSFNIEWAKGELEKLNLPETLEADLLEVLDELQNGYQVSFPLIEDPGRALFPLLLGQDADLFKLEAHFNPVTDYSETFGTPIGLDAGLKGTFEPELDLTFGLDTYGLRTWVSNLYNGDSTSPSDLLGGFYFGEDTAFRLKAGIEATAGVNAVVFHANISGGVTGDFNIEVPEDVRNAPGDKVRLRLDLGNSLFHVTGDVTAHLTATAGVGIEFPFGNFVGVEKEWVLAEKQLLKFNFGSVPNPWAAPEDPPLLATQAADGTLTLNVGALNGSRNYKPDLDDETYYVVGESHGGGLAVEINFLGQRERYEGVTAIVGDAGDGNDNITIDLGPARVGVPVDLSGGDGNDALSVIGSTSIVLRGNNGDDSLTADRGGQAGPGGLIGGQISVEGGNGVDVLVAIGGHSVSLSGGQGHDTASYEGQGSASIYGDSGNDSLYGGGGDNHIEGGAGHDVLIGGGGENTLYGNAGDDHLTAGPRGDRLFGGDGSDGYIAGAGDDRIDVTDGEPFTTEHISWEYGDGNTFIDAPNGDGTNGLKVVLGMFGSPDADTFHMRDANVAAGTVRIDAPGGKVVTGSGLDDVSIDGRDGADHVIIEALHPTQDIDRIAVNLNDNLDNDGAVDLIEVFGSAGDDALVVDQDQVVLEAYEPGDTRHPENLNWGGVMTIAGMPQYTVFAMNIADDLRVQTVGGADTVQVNSVTGPTRIDTGSGDDVVHVSADEPGEPGVVTNDGPIPPDYAAQVTVEAGTGTNVLTVDQAAATSGDTFDVTDQRISSSLLPGVNFLATGGDFSTVAVFGTALNDVFRIQSTSALVAETGVLGLSGADTFEIGSEAGSLADIRGALTITAGAAGGSTAILSDRSATSGNTDVLLAGATVTGLAGPADDVPVRLVSAGGDLTVEVEASQDAAVVERFTLEAFNRPLHIAGGKGDETFDVRALSAQATLHGGAGDDHYAVGDDLGLLGATLTVADIDGRNVIDVDDSAAPGGRIYEMNANALRIVGSPYDQLQLGGASGEFSMLTSDGGDQFRAFGAPAGLAVVVDLAGGNNVLVGPNTAATRWDITAEDEVVVAKRASFRHAANLVGGAADDQFAFAPAGHITGLIMGGAGTDTLDYSALTGPVFVDLASGKATGVGAGVFGIDQVTGGSGDDVLLGDANANRLDGGGGDDLILGRDGKDVLFGGAGRDLLIGGLGTDRIFGGAGEDLLIGGTTAHDADLDTLADVLRTWRNAEADYRARVGALRAGALTAATVFDDAENDILHGQQDLDWFWAFGGDNLDRVLGETIR